MPKKKAKKKKVTRKAAASSRGLLKIVRRRGRWIPIGPDGKDGTKIIGTVPPGRKEVVIEVHSVVGPRNMPVPPHVHKGPSHPPYNTHCHKTIYIGGVPYLVHC
jgi:hypothetical protein